ncbi:hypothetical protein PRZ48_003418 [Zasmidium cellare]|uniref:Uncharacterized protein n=1 Tax=Zasmidium cellare TaxID=395010 RepID=A0ABR0EWJ7_ZASCE|nr:hypothetical protein PRZ48_003418 [Zasmidium cellare]
MSHSWLQRQRKQALLDLCVEAGLPQKEDLLKDELVALLETTLTQNPDRLSRVAAFDDYYGKRARTPGRPPKERESVFVPSGEDEIDVKSAVKSKVRRATKVKQEQDEPDPISSPIAAASSSARKAIATVSSTVSSALSPSGQLVSRTPAPRPSTRRRSELPGPPSPSDVADVVEYESTKFASGVRDLYARSGITENIESLRESLSSVNAIQLSFLLLEAFALQRRVLPWRYMFDIPSTGLTPSIAVFLPDLFVLLTGFYWSTTLLWSATSIFVPILFAYFYNLTMRDVKRGNTRVTVARYAADPFTYNVVKALATWLVYVKGVNFGFIDPEVAERVDLAVYGGSTAILIGSAVGALAALYEAAQKKAVAA